MTEEKGQRKYERLVAQFKKDPKPWKARALMSFIRAETADETRKSNITMTIPQWFTIQSAIAMEKEYS